MADEDLRVTEDGRSPGVIAGQYEEFPETENPPKNYLDQLEEELRLP